METNENSSNKGKRKEETLTVLTLGEVADMLRVHRSTISRYAKAGELKSYRIGMRRLFRVEDVCEFFDAQVDRGYVFGEER